MDKYTRRAGAFLLAFVIAVALGSWVERERMSIPVSQRDRIVLLSPHTEQVVTSPLFVRGEAPGTWFFEASFPVVLTNWDGLIIAQGVAQAKADWMTEKPVPFEATLLFDVPQPIAGVVNRGSLILKKDNPSGLLQNDDALEIDVMF